MTDRATDLSQEAVERAAHACDAVAALTAIPKEPTRLYPDTATGALVLSVGKLRAIIDAAALLRDLWSRLAEVERERDEALRRIPTTLGAASTEP